MLKREDWLDLARKLDWTYSYVSEQEVFPEAVSGRPWLAQPDWQQWDEPYRTTFSDYVRNQCDKNASVEAVREAVGRLRDVQQLDRSWLSAVKLHAATLPLAEFAAVIGNLRAARFGRDSAWRTTATFGGLDELRHTQIPLQVLHELVGWDRQFDWTHKLLHTNDWVAVAGRHLIDELLLGCDAVEFAIGTHFVFETGFTNLQFVGLSAAARLNGDRMFEKMVQSIQTDEARHAQIGSAVLQVVVKHDAAYAQFLVDKWFWRSWLFFAVVTGFAMDYLAPLTSRKQSFREFVAEWIEAQFERLLREYGLARPWYWDRFLEATQTYHHMAYASAYTHRKTVWFDTPRPGAQERAWLLGKYPQTWPAMEPVWDRIAVRGSEAGEASEWYTHGLTPIVFCNLCQLPLCAGTTNRNAALWVAHAGRRYLMCSEPCAWIFRQQPQRYTAHQGVVERILSGRAPPNLLELVHRDFELSTEEWGCDSARGQRGSKGVAEQERRT